MPSGLTYKIYNGTDTSLRGFALACVGQLGAGYQATNGGESKMPRDKAPVLKVPKFYYENIEKAEKELEHWLNVKNDDKLCELFYNNEQEERVGNRVNYATNKDELKKRYLNMLQKVESWNVDYEYSSLKELMVKQLHESLEFDCRDSIPYTVTVPTIEEWINAKIADARNNIEYSKRMLAQEEQSVAQTNAYLKGLYEAIDSFEKENNESQ